MMHGTECSCCCRDEPIMQCQFEEADAPARRDEEFNRIYIVLEYIFDVNAVMEMMLTLSGAKK